MPRMTLVAAAAACALLGLPANAQSPQPGPAALKFAPVAAAGAFTRLRAANAPDLTPAQRNQIQIIGAARGVTAINVAMAMPQQIRSTAVGQALQIEVSPGVRFSARAVAAEPLAGGGMIWRGEVASARPDLPPGMATFVIDGDKVTGSIHGPGGELYQVRPLPDGGTAVVKIDYASMPLDEPPASGGDLKPSAPRAQIAPTQLAPQRPSAALRPGAAELARPTLASQISVASRFKCLPCIYNALTPTIDVLVAYTPSAAAASGDINGLINLAIAETNDSFTLSGVKAQLRLVGTMPVTYNEAGRTFEDMVAQFAGTSDGYMDEVHARRNTLHADVAVLIINNDAWCGRADDIGATAATAFVIVHYSCATGYYSFGHEIGHLLGARHDLTNDGTPTPFSYGHGLQHSAASGGWRTIMAYACGGHQCDPRLQYWSNPSNSHAGVPMGSASENNTAVWNARAATVAAFR